jgi:FOG: HEAT repeat
MAITVQKVEKWSAKKKTAKLLKALEINDLNVRIAVIQALGRIKDENVMYKLVLLLKDSNPSIRASSAEALGNMGNVRSLEFVRQLWTIEQDQDVREKSRIAIAKIKENTKLVETT